MAIASGASHSAEPMQPTPMPVSMVRKAEGFDAQIREQFEREQGHKATTHELLEWLDRKSLAAKDLDDAERDLLVQSYGSVLGQLLVRELGGQWVLVPNHDNLPGVDLPRGKTAFVFNRAGRRIFESDRIGFVSFFAASERFARGNALPAHIEAYQR